MRRIESSFRDPSGQVYERDGEIVRTVNSSYSEHWRAVEQSGIFEKGVHDGLVVPFRECDPVAGILKSLSVTRVPFITYPHEWCFGQLRDAALLTLRLNKRAIKKGLALKDASANMRSFRGKTEWADHYNDTNYTSTAATFKADFIKNAAGAGSLAVDLGANTGRYSRLLADSHGTVLALDIDPMAVETHYQALKKDGPGNIVPLVIPAGIPLELVARHLAELVRPGGKLIFEFVPKEDSQIRRLLSVRKDIFDTYHKAAMLGVFAPHFEHVREQAIPESVRALHLFRKRS